MSQENVEIVRRAFEAFNRGDSEGMVADIALCDGPGRTRTCDRRIMSPLL